jgi:hypothetical protein
MKKNNTEIELKKYTEELKHMNLADLQSHAISLGFKPSPYRPSLERMLINQFHKKINPIYKESKTKLSKEKQRKIDSVLSSWR